MIIFELKIFTKQFQILRNELFKNAYDSLKPCMGSSVGGGGGVEGKEVFEIDLTIYLVSGRWVSRSV